MNKKVKALAIVAILIFLLIGLGSFFLPKSSPQPVKQTQKTDETSNKIESLETTLKGLLSMGKSLKCSFDLKDASISGTVYAGNGKVREDFQSNAVGSSMSGHLIVDSTNSFMWTDGSDQGFKFPVEQITSDEPTITPAKNPGQDIYKSMNFTCRSWKVDDSVFLLPNTVTFQSFKVPGVNPSAGTSTTGITNQSACAACDNIPAGEARSACKTQLKCQ